jgi:hypothetical protein
VVEEAGVPGEIHLFKNSKIEKLLQIQIYLSCIDSFISNKTTGSTIGAGTIFQFSTSP